MKLVRVVLTFVVERDKYMSLISNILDKFGISATLAQADDFEKWLVNEVWKKYSEEKILAIILLSQILARIL